MGQWAARRITVATTELRSTHHGHLFSARTGRLVELPEEAQQVAPDRQLDNVHVLMLSVAVLVPEMHNTDEEDMRPGRVRRKNQSRDGNVLFFRK